jgi:hypothetical protein
VPGRFLPLGAVAQLQFEELSWGKPTLRAESREVMHFARTGQG